MKKILRITALLLSVLLFAVSAAHVAAGRSTADAKEAIDPTRTCSLKLTYRLDGKALEGMEIALYRVANVSADFQYRLTGAFSDYSVEVNGVQSQSEWKEITDTLEAYILADKPAPNDTKTTDSSGIVQYAGLAVGLYLVRWTGNETVDQVYGFAPFLVSVPGLGEDGKWIYDVDALPKPGLMPEPETDKLTLVKLWRDGSQSNKRPKSVAVDIFRNGQLYKTVELTAAGNWTYTWETDGTYTWTAVERNVPDGYTVTVQSKDGNTIQITNTLPDNPPPPYTGDSTNTYVRMMLTALSGIILIVLGVHRRKADEE